MARAVEVSRAEQRPGRTAEERRGANAPLLERVFDPERFPTGVRVGAAAGAALQDAYDPKLAFEFGLGRILDGVEALISSRGAPLDGR